MLYTLYIGINLTIIMKQYGDRQTVQRLRPLYPLWILEGAGQQTKNSTTEATLFLCGYSGELANITVTVTVTAGINYYRCNVLYSTVLYCTILYRPIHRYPFT